MRGKHGELITLVWDCIPDAEYVKGHVTAAEAGEALDGAHGEGSSGEISETRHRWARWQFIGNFEGHTHDLCIQNEKGKGMFPVTELVLKGGVK